MMVPDQDLELAASCAHAGPRPAAQNSATVNGMERLAMNPNVNTDFHSGFRSLAAYTRLPPVEPFRCIFPTRRPR